MCSTKRVFGDFTCRTTLHLTILCHSTRERFLAHAVLRMRPGQGTLGPYHNDVSTTLC